VGKGENLSTLIGGSMSKKLREKIEKFKGLVLKFLGKITET
jgi:hypothetical protein